MNYKLNISLLVLMLASAADCSSEQPERQQKIEAPKQRVAPQITKSASPAPVDNRLPAGVRYKIIQEDKLHNIKRSLDIRLNKKVSEETLKKIALHLKASDSVAYERTFITYYLDDMKVGSGAWATTHFNPNLKVVVQGLTVEQEAKVLGASAEKADGDREIIGSWLDETLYAGNKATMYSKKGKLFLERVYSDGSSGSTELKTKKVRGEKRYIEVGNEHGEYYLINGEGNLQVFDGDGLISTAKKI